MTRRTRRRPLPAWVRVLWFVVVTVVFVAVYVSSRNESGSAAPAPQALPELDAIAVTSAEWPDYERDYFGSGWKDTDHNGCDARNDVLQRDLSDAVIKPGTGGCVVLSGHLDDPYTGRGIDFVRGNDTSTMVQIDHVVPLAWAWRNGAWAWSDEQRIAFANDGDNLLAVDGATNQSKSDSGPADWLPDDPAYACDYATAWVEVLTAYRLTITVEDREALRATLATCA